MAIQRDGWKIFQFRQFRFLFGNLRLNVAQRFNLFIARVHVNFVVYRVEDQIVAVFHLRGDVAGAHDSGKFQRTRHNRRVGRTATDIGDETQHLFQVQLCGFRRR